MPLSDAHRPLYEVKANLFKGLAHPLRIRILELLSDSDEVSVARLGEETGLEASHLSQHLSVLRRHRLVVSERRASHVYYRLADRRTAEMLAVARALLLEIVRSDGHRRRGDVDETSPIADFASQLPPPIRSELRQHLQHTGVLGPSAIDADTAARIIRPFAWLMDAVGADGLDLTAAGWMPQSTVLAGMTELGWITDWIGKGNREDVTPPIAVLRETAQRIGLVRVQKGRLLLSAAAKKALGDAPAQLRLIAEGLYRKLSDAETDAAVLLLLAIADGTPREDRWRSVAFGLEMCGWQSSSGWRFTEQDIGHATFWTQRVLNQLGDAPRLHRFDEESPLLRPFAREALR